MLLVSWEKALTGTLSYTLVVWSSGNTLYGFVDKYLYVNTLLFALACMLVLTASIGILSTDLIATWSDSLYNISTSVTFKLVSILA